MKIRLLHLLVPSLALVVSSCSKAPGPDMNLAIPAPGNVTLSLDQTTLSAGWEYPAGEAPTGFIAQLAGDKDFKNLIGADTLTAGTDTVHFQNVGLLNQYYFRIMATADNIAKNSVFATASITLENLFQPVGASDVTGTSVTLHWDAPAEGTVTGIVVISDGGAPLPDYTLSASEVSSQTAEITGLEVATGYTAILYDKQERKGVVTFKTLDTRASITLNAGTDSYASLQDAIDAAAPGDVVNIRGTYDFSASGPVQISKSLTIRTLEGAPMATLKTGIFDLSGNPGAFTLSGLKLIGTGAQTIGLSDLGGTADVTIEDCDLSGPTAGLIYASSSATAATASLAMHNCMVHDFGATGGDFIDFRAGTVTGLDIRNSTFCNLARAFFRIDNPVAYAGSDPIVFENCTVNNVCNGGRFIYIRAGGITMQINKCILANEISNQSNGIPATTANDNNVSGSNADSFLQFMTQTGTTTLDPQFAGTSAEDFTVGNATLKAAAIGDPRWLP